MRALCSLCYSMHKVVGMHNCGQQSWLVLVKYMSKNKGYGWGTTPVNEGK